MSLLGFLYCLINRKVEDTRHRADNLSHSFAGAYKEGINQRLRSQPSFSHHRPQSFVLTEPTQSGNRESHKEIVFEILERLAVSRRLSAFGRSSVVPAVIADRLEADRKARDTGKRLLAETPTASAYSLLVPQITLVINSARPYPLYNPPIQGKILP